MRRIFHAAAGAIVLCWATLVVAIVGDLDPSFNPGGLLPPGIPGIVTTLIGNGTSEATSVVVQTDGKIVAAGRAFDSGAGFYDFALARYFKDGSLDTSFGIGGIQTTSIGVGDSVINSIALQADGKIVAAGTSFNGADTDFTIARYTTAGTLDPSFGTGGIVIRDVDVNDDLQSVVIQNDGKIVVAGNAGPDTMGQFTIARYTTTGVLDPSFGGTGIVITPVGFTSRIQSLALQQDGSIVAGGTSIDNSFKGNFAIARYFSNGNLDPSFGSGGITITNIVGGDDLLTGIGLQSTGKIVAAGLAGNGTDFDMVLVRYTAQGALDLSFGFAGTGIVIMDFSMPQNDGLLALTIQPNNKIVTTGIAVEEGTLVWVLLRYCACGVLDKTFHKTGFMVTPLNSDSTFLQQGIALQLDGNIVVAGNTANGVNFEFAVARYIGGESGPASPLAQALQAKYCCCKRDS